MLFVKIQVKNQKSMELLYMLPNEFKLIHDIKSFTLMVKRWFKINQTCSHIKFSYGSLLVIKSSQVKSPLFI